MAPGDADPALSRAPGLTAEQALEQAAPGRHGRIWRRCVSALIFVTGEDRPWRDAALALSPNGRVHLVPLRLVVHRLARTTQRVSLLS